MLLKARIMLQLQEGEVIGKATIADAHRGLDPVERMDRHQQKPLQIQLEFLGNAHRPMWFEIPVIAVSEHHKPVVKRAVKHVLAHVTPMAWRQGRLHVGLGKCGLHLLDRHIHQPRIAIGAAPFIGHPIGAHVAFFEHMHGDAAPLGLGHGHGMDGAHIAIKDDIGDPFFVQKPGKCCGPIGAGAAKGDVTAWMEPKGPVARIEADAPHRCPRAPQHRAEPVKEWPVRPLQKQENAGVGGIECHLVPDRWHVLIQDEHVTGAIL
mmetsp:Transcript_23304/g.40389  ORF Transcript_23304/g.40389 Transcript_23304/m.40389 type:complete len:264 (-) Transcript_23304:1789-2580(-)